MGIIARCFHLQLGKFHRCFLGNYEKIMRYWEDIVVTILIEETKNRSRPACCGFLFLDGRICDLAKNLLYLTPGLILYCSRGRG